jgi:GTP-binding protein
MIDTAIIKVKAGNGGDGSVHFRREKFIPKGGPDGGDGGNGGSVYFISDNNLATLMDFRSKALFKAEDGVFGTGRKMYGANGSDLNIKVPVGTLVYESYRGKDVLIGDMSETGKVLLIAKGGIGGKGNFKFRSSVNQTPLQYTAGTAGEEKELRLELRLMADIGLVGAPNAGKSTLINKLTNANAKVGAYPFTTLEPNLGTCTLRSGQTVVLADIPGLIEGASSGKGLGAEFLRHVDRTRVLIHLVDVFYKGFDTSSKEIIIESALEAYKMIRAELNNASEDLANKKEIVVINKLDITEVKDAFDDIKKAFKKIGVTVLGISAVTGEGLDVLLEQVTETLAAIPQKPTYAESKPVKIYTIDSLPNKRIVFNDKTKVLTSDRPI